MKLYFKYVSTQLKARLAYRSNSLFSMFGQVLLIIASLTGIICLFSKFSTLGEYTLKDILVTYSIIVFIFSFDEMMFRGFDEFEDLTRTGEMDKLLLRPRNLVLQICGQKVETSKFSRVIAGLVLIVFSCIYSNIQWNFFKVLVLIEMILSGIITFFGVYLLTSSITIFTIKKAEFINILTDGGKELCYYPLNIFKKFICKFFTFIIPFASFNYIPLRYLLGFADASAWYAVYPLVCIPFAIISYFIFMLCMRHYKCCC